jgi:DNA-binding MarR family transcriptional regulator
MNQSVGVEPGERAAKESASATSAGPFVFSLIHVARVVEGRLEAALEGVGLSMAKHGLLQILADAGEPLTLSELAERVSCVRSNITQLVDRLEAEGLVQRVDDHEDRRIIRARLTRAGADRQVAGARVIASVQAEVAAAVSSADQAALEKLVSKLA